MVVTLGNDAAEVGHQNIGSHVQPFLPVGAGCVPLAPAFEVAPVNLFSALSLQLIVAIVRGIQITQPIVESVVVAVMNHLRLFAGGEKPADAMSQVCDTVVSDSIVTAPVLAPHWLAGVRSLSFHFPYQIAR